MKQEYEAQSVDLQNQIDTKKANSADCDNEIAYAQEMANECKPDSGTAGGD